jgi:hypothetical protein
MLKYSLLTINIVIIILLIFWVCYNRSAETFFDIMNSPLKFFAVFIFFYIDLFNSILIYWANASILILKDSLTEDVKIEEELIVKPVEKKPNTNQSKMNINQEYFNPPTMTTSTKELIVEKKDKDKMFYQVTNFHEFSLKEHIKYYRKFFMEGVEKSYNLLNMCSQLSRLCFLDKDGLIFKKEKEIVEMAFFKSNNNIEILNVQADESRQMAGDNFYTIEEENQQEIINNIKPIVLCSSVVKIPQENDRTDKLVFLESNKIKNVKKILPVAKLNKYSRILKERSGYLYSATNIKLRAFFQDCLCLLTKSAGFSDTVLKSHKNIKNFWHTNFLKYDNIDFDSQNKMIAENLDETEECILIIKKYFFSYNI